MVGFIWALTTVSWGWTLVDLGLYHKYVTVRPFYLSIMKDY